MLRQKKILKTIMLSSTIISPIVLLSSCSSSNDLLNDLINDFLEENSEIVVPIEEQQSKILQYPAQLYIDNDSSSLVNFELSSDFENLIQGKDVDVKFNYSKIIDGTKLEFNISIVIGNEVIETNSVVSGFVTWHSYARSVTSYFQSLNLNTEHKNKYTLKEFLKNFLPKKNETKEWMNILDIKCPPGFGFEFNNDIKTTRYDFNNQKLVIGYFYLIKDKKRHQDLSISITNNFKSAQKPLYVFVVTDEGVKINSEDNLGINAEVVFINRTSDNIIKFNEKWLGKAVYGELDLSEFKNWELKNQEIGTGYFQSNFITHIKLPKEVIELGDSLFLSNKILIFDTENKIKKIHNNSFDSNVKFENLLSLGLSLYYDEKTKTMDFINENIKSLQELLDVLKLLIHKPDSIIVNAIKLNGELFNQSKKSNQLIKDINKLSLTIDEVIFAGNVDTSIDNELSLDKWQIKKITILENILSIDMIAIKKKRVIDRKFNSKISNLVKNGSLDLDSAISNIPGYEEANFKLNNYFDSGDPKNNIVQNLHLENKAIPTSLNFHNIFKTFDHANPIKIFIYGKTNLLTNDLINSITNSKAEVDRVMPENLTNILLVDGHLNLENSADIFVDNFYTNIKYLKTDITKLTLPTNIKTIPSYAFYDINLSKIDINILNSIEEVGNFAFYKSSLKGNLNMSFVNKIGQNSFSYNNLTSINLPEVISIGVGGFQNNKLISIFIPKITVILNNTFDKNLLTAISLFDIQSIGSNAFSNNEKLKSVNFNIVPEITKTSFDQGVEINIDDKLTFIPELISLSSSNGIIIDFSHARPEPYSYAKAINQINILLTKKVDVEEVIWDLDLIPENESSITGFSQTNIASINKLTIKQPETNYRERKLHDYLFQNIKINEVVGLENVEIIGKAVFQNSYIQKFNNLEGELRFNSNLEILDANSFEGNNITHLIFENGVKAEITQNSFIRNDNLVKIIIPSSILYVSGGAFSINKWQFVDRTPAHSIASNKLPWSLENGVLYFKEMISSSELIIRNIKNLNGLKIEKIKFGEDIYFIPSNFLKDLKISNNQFEIDLSNILVINDNSFIGNNLTIKPGSSSNVIYNDINSGLDLMTDI